MMKQILIYCVMQRENPQDAIALAESPRDEFVVILYFLPRTWQPRKEPVESTYELIIS